jgi:hypothetical protein
VQRGGLCECRKHLVDNSAVGGVEDPAVWNRFQAEGRLRDDFKGRDIHISCRVPDDPELARKLFFTSTCVVAD